MNQQDLLRRAEQYLPGTCLGMMPLPPDLRGVFQKRCVECHGGKEPKASLDLTTPEGIARGGRRGAIVAPGKPDSSRLWPALSRTDQWTAQRRCDRRRLRNRRRRDRGRLEACASWLEARRRLEARGPRPCVRGRRTARCRIRRSCSNSATDPGRLGGPGRCLGPAGSAPTGTDGQWGGWHRSAPCPVPGPAA